MCDNQRYSFDQLWVEYCNILYLPVILVITNNYICIIRVLADSDEQEIIISSIMLVFVYENRQLTMCSK